MRCTCGTPIELFSPCCPDCVDDEIDKKMGGYTTEGRVGITLSVEPAFKRALLIQARDQGVAVPEIIRQAVLSKSLVRLDDEATDLLKQISAFHGLKPGLVIKELLEAERDALGHWFRDRRELNLEVWKEDAP